MGIRIFPSHNETDRQEQQEQSCIGRISKVIEPVFRPQGFDWKLDVGLVAGVSAKEIVASTMGVLYTDDSSYAEGNDDTINMHLYKQMRADGITPLIAFCYLLFVLLYFPCIATIAAIKNGVGQLALGTVYGCLHHRISLGNISSRISGRRYVFMIINLGHT